MVIVKNMNKKNHLKLKKIKDFTSLFSIFGSIFFVYLFIKFTDVSMETYLKFFPPFIITVFLLTSVYLLIKAHQQSGIRFIPKTNLKIHIMDALILGLAVFVIGGAFLLSPILSKIVDLEDLVFSIIIPVTIYLSKKIYNKEESDSKVQPNKIQNYYRNPYEKSFPKFTDFIKKPKSKVKNKKQE